MKKFTKYITKKRAKIIGMLGDNFNIPAKTVCDCFPNGDKEIIYYNHHPICYTTSENAKQYFWGYDESNPNASLEWNKYRDKLIESHPDFSRERDEEFIRSWEQYGGVLFFVGDNIKWGWNDQTLDSSTEQIKYLLKCIKEDKAPLSILRKGGDAND